MTRQGFSSVDALAATPQSCAGELAQALRGHAQYAARGKRRRASVAGFLLDVDARCAELAARLVSRRYTPGAGRAFWICDPKRRLIYALPFADRVVQHFLIAQTLVAIERRLSPQVYACRVQKGTHRGLAQAAALHRRYPWVLRVDIQKFFPSIDHQILSRRLDRVTPPSLRWLSARFLAAPVAVERADFHFPGDDLFAPQRRPHGLPIGSLTSQIWANYYLSPLDDLLRSHLGITTFVRYCDDLLVYGDDPGQLREVLARLTEQATALRLRLHPRKTRLHQTTEPLPFLGFVLQREGSAVSVRLRRENIVRMRRRVRSLRALFWAGAIEPREVSAHLSAWLAHAKHGHTRALIDREIVRWRFVLRDDEDRLG